MCKLRHSQERERMQAFTHSARTGKRQATLLFPGNSVVLDPRLGRMSSVYKKSLCECRDCNELITVVRLRGWYGRDEPSFADPPSAVARRNSSIEHRNTISKYGSS